MPICRLPDRGIWIPSPHVREELSAEMGSVDPLPFSVKAASDGYDGWLDNRRHARARERVFTCDVSYPSPSVVPRGFAPFLGPDAEPVKAAPGVLVVFVEMAIAQLLAEFLLRP